VNFIFCELRPDAAEFAERLRAEGVIVQPLGAWGAPTAIRVSVGTPEQNARLLALLSKIRQ
jgi:histidinol-phosphate aminotransferase